MHHLHQQTFISPENVKLKIGIVRCVSVFESLDSKTLEIKTLFSKVNPFAKTNLSN